MAFKLLSLPEIKQSIIMTVAAVRQIKQVLVWSRHVESAQKFAKEIAKFYDVEVCEQLSFALKSNLGTTFKLN